MITLGCILALDCKNKRYKREAIWAAGAAALKAGHFLSVLARARSIPVAGCDERATKPATQRANAYGAYFCHQALVSSVLQLRLQFGGNTPDN